MTNNILSLSQEVHSLIFNQILQKQDIQSLSLTSKALSEAGQQARFDTINIYGDFDKIQELNDILADTPHIGCHIRTIAIYALTDDDRFIDVLRQTTGLKVLNLHFIDNYPVPVNLIPQLGSKSITALSISTSTLCIQLINNILHHLPALFYLALISEEYEVKDIFQNNTTASRSPLHSSLQILHIICISSHIAEIISTLISSTTINWLMIEQLAITQQVEDWEFEVPLYTFHPRLISMLANNLVFLHLSLTEERSKGINVMTYGK